MTVSKGGALQTMFSFCSERVNPQQPGPCDIGRGILNRFPMARRRVAGLEQGCNISVMQQN
jgi:hypothetical protein